LLLVVFQSPAKAQEKTSAKDLALYSEIKSFSLTGGAVDVNGLVIKTLPQLLWLELISRGLANGQIINCGLRKLKECLLLKPHTDLNRPTFAG
jgi:hypothetical protein